MDRPRNIVNGTKDPVRTGSFVPFTIIPARSTGRAMQVNSNAPVSADHARLPDLDRALVEAAEEMTFNWPEIRPLERFKRGISEFAGFAELGAKISLILTPAGPLVYNGGRADA
jgi:hypothetical protein